MKFISEFIGRGLVDNDISISELSKRSGINKRTIESYLYQGCVPTVEKFLKLIHALGYQIEIKKVGG